MLYRTSMAPLVERSNLAEIALDRTIHRDLGVGPIWTIPYAGFHKTCRRSRADPQLGSEDVCYVAPCQVDNCQEFIELFNNLVTKVER